MKKLIIITFVGIVAYFILPLLFLIGIGWIMSLFSGETEAKVESLLSEVLDPERDSAWDGRDLNAIYDYSLGD